MRYNRHDFLGQALQIASLGWPLFPLHEPGCSCGRPKCPREGKHPRTRNGLKDATTDAAQIRKWWQRWPTANIGLRTGFGLVVVDIDGQPGKESARRLRLPLTVTTRTGRGHHLFYRCETTIRNSRGRLGAGIDVRGENGYVILPPSRHVSGRRYGWIAAPWRYEPTELPEAIVLASCAVSKRSSRTYSAAGGETAQDGASLWEDQSRSGRDARAVLNLVRQGLTRKQIHAEFVEFSEKYEEKLQSGEHVADTYFGYTYEWAIRFHNANRHVARIEQASLEQLGATSGRDALTRVLLQLVTLDDGEVIDFQLVVPSDDRSTSADIWKAAVPDLDPDDVAARSGYQVVRGLVGRRLDVVLRGSRVVWASAVTKK